MNFYGVLFKLITLKVLKTYDDLFINANRYFYRVNYFGQDQILYVLKYNNGTKFVRRLFDNISQNLLVFLYSIVITAYFGTLRV